MTTSIRWATEHDAATVFRFICDLAEYEREPDQVQTSASDLERQLKSDAPPFECLLLEEEGTAVAFALFFISYSTWRGKRGLYLEDLFVTPSARGKGYGKALLKRCASIAVERGYARMEWAALNWNTPAIEFYQAAGAEALNEWTTFRLSDEALRAAAGPNHNTA